MKNKSIYSASLIFLISFLLIFIRCDKDDPPPTGPTSVEEHIFYICGKTGGTVKLFSAEKRAFTDSVVFSNIPDNTGIGYLHVIGDDEKLLAFTVDGAYIMDLKTGVIDSSFPSLTNLLISPNTEYYLTRNNSLDRWELRRFDTHEPIYTDTASMSMARFSTDSKSLAYTYPVKISSNTYMRLAVYDIIKDTVYRKPLYYNTELTIWYPQPLTNKNKTFFGSNDWTGFYATVSDFGSDSARILANLPFQTTAYSRISPDEKYVFSVITASWDYEPTIILVFDVDAEELVSEISTKDVHQVSLFSISHDGKYLVTLPSQYNGTSVGLFDAKNFELIDGYDFGEIPNRISSKGNY